MKVLLLFTKLINHQINFKDEPLAEQYSEAGLPEEGEDY